MEKNQISIDKIFFMKLLIGSLARGIAMFHCTIISALVITLFIWENNNSIISMAIIISFAVLLISIKLFFLFRLVNTYKGKYIQKVIHHGGLILFFLFDISGSIILLFTVTNKLIHILIITIWLLISTIDALNIFKTGKKMDLNELDSIIDEYKK